MTVTSQWSLSRLLTEVIGSGPKSAADMTYEQAYGAVEQVLLGDTDPTTLGAFLLANRWKGNTPRELAGFLDAMRDHAVEPVAPEVGPVDCGANYDGKRETALLGVAAGLVAAAAGTPVSVHSAGRVPASRGVTYRHVLEELGVETDISPSVSAEMIDAIGFGFYYAPRFNPGVHGMLDRREAMGVRTLFNTIETLANPADARVHVGSFYHLSFANRMIETVRESQRVEMDRIVMVQGLEGYDDIRPGVTTVAEWKDGVIRESKIQTAEYGMAVTRDDLGVNDVARESAAITQAVIGGNGRRVFEDAVALNAAVRIYAGGDADSLENGMDLARDTLESGRPLQLLERLQLFDG